MAIALILVVTVLLAATVKNEGCLPWQERVGRENATRCSGSWFPFGWAIPPHSLGLVVIGHG